MNPHTRWWMHLLSCAEKGAQACRDGLSLSQCPYQGRGVNRQRMEHWRQGYLAEEYLKTKQVQNQTASAVLDKLKVKL